MTDRPRPACLTPSRGFWDGWTDATAAARQALEAGLDEVTLDGITGAERDRQRRVDRSPVTIGRNLLAVMLGDVHRGDPDVLHHARVVVAHDPDAAAEALQLATWLIAGYLPTTTPAEPRSESL